VYPMTARGELFLTAILPPVTKITTYRYIGNTYCTLYYNHVIIFTPVWFRGVIWPPGGDGKPAYTTIRLYYTVVAQKKKIN